MRYLILAIMSILMAANLASFPYCVSFSQADTVELIIWSDLGVDTVQWLDTGRVCTTFADTKLDSADLWIFYLRIFYQGADDWLMGFDSYLSQANPVYDEYPYCLQFSTADSVRWIHIYGDNVDTVIFTEFPPGQDGVNRVCTTLAAIDLIDNYEHYFLLEILYDGASEWIGGSEDFIRAPCPALPEDADLCLAYARFYDGAGNPIKGIRLHATLIREGYNIVQDTCSNTFMAGYADKDWSDSTGLASLTLIKSKCFSQIEGRYRFHVFSLRHGLNYIFTDSIPDSTSYKLKGFDW